MMQLRDWVSGAIGAIILLLGLLPLLGKFESLNNLPGTVVIWIVSLAGFYLIINSIIEITNSNVVGWVSFGIAFAALIIGFFPALHSLGVGPGWFEFAWIGRTAYNVIFIIEGAFLMIATFAMEL
ncbi:hypothetical protein HYT54_00705 [Candidatus Woesearchaeota archaeon]|nr:hypothetical protein [Candidatus Woesearchaeota archaeon]